MLPSVHNKGAAAGQPASESKHSQDDKISSRNFYGFVHFNHLAQATALSIPLHHFDISLTKASVCMTRICRNYHGHVVDHLKTLRDGLLSQGKNTLIYLMGDSSLDNK